ncbi:MAG: 2-C-methyl-D-erythritol 2,4-cyclodiphosphate synthase [Acholeplasmataceae bacterium]|nr:2-C-methyl-D-erythritol 2,4-cyclodiphosphate synthase [Acholeplasmataceae bacterium]
MNTALIVGAGTGTRTKLNQSKILLEIHHKPLFLYSVETFLELGYEIVLVVSKSDYELVKELVPTSVTIVLGGKTRGESVMKGLKEIQTPYVFIHDAARPLISKSKIEEIEKALSVHDAILLAEPMTQALKKFENGVLKSEIRDHYIQSQTPQAFLTEKIRYAYLRSEQTFDDDIGLYQSFYPEEAIHVVMNDEPNLKVTYAKDLVLVEALMNQGNHLRIGKSFDLHRLVEGRPLILGGIKLPFSKGLLGHSDADVLLHAIGESMLGALSLGDLGTFYPDTDPKYKDVNSMDLLIDIHKKIQDKGYQIVNIDSTVFAEYPKLNPYISKIKENICEHLSIDLDQISVKATTYEGLESIGRGEAIAAEAICLLRRNIS